MITLPKSKLLLITGLILIILTSVIVYHHVPSTAELRLFHGINGVGSVHSPVGTFLASTLSNLVYAAAGAVAVLLLFKRYRLNAWRIAVPVASAFILENIIERIIKRPRPNILIADTIIRAVQSGPGFPSGHMAVATALLVVLWQRITLQWRVIGLILIVAVAWARIYLGVHAPLDVVAGVAVGMFVPPLIGNFPMRWLEKFHLS